MLIEFNGADLRWTKDDRREWYVNGKVYVDPSQVIAVDSMFDAPDSVSTITLTGNEATFNVWHSADEVAKAINGL